MSTYSSINDCPEDIQAYVKEVTQDIATEIKSELREVISKVDNVLENTEPMDGSFNLSTFQHFSSADEMKNSDAVSASDVAQYLREFSIEMASEVKSEIREMCATVKDFNEQPRRSSPTDLEGLKMCLKEVMGGDVGHRRSETAVLANGTRTAGAGTGSVPSGIVGCDLKPSRSESFPSRCTSSQGWQNTSVDGVSAGSSSRTGTQQAGTQARNTGAISKLSDSTETASRDSGINLCFGDGDSNQSLGFNSRYV